MSQFVGLEQRFAQLTQELTPEHDLAERVLQRAADPVWAPGAPAEGRTRLVRAWFLAPVAATLFAIGLWSLVAPESIEARMLAALQNVRSAHLTGWTRHIVRKWPLEQPERPQVKEEHVPVDSWYWTDDQGNQHSYEQQGPVVLTRNGNQMREYQSDVNLLYVFDGAYEKDKVGQLTQLARYLEKLDRRGLSKRSLGTRKDGEATLSGLELRQGNEHAEIWWDMQTFLPVKLVEYRISASGEQIERELNCTYELPVPAEIADFAPPEAKYVRHGGSEAAQAWRKHVEVLGQHLIEKPLQGGVAILPRTDRERFAMQWTMKTPDGDYRVIPFSGRDRSMSTLADFIRLQVATDDSELSLANWKIAEDLQQIELEGDLVYRSDVPWQEWLSFALLQLGLEYVDVVENRTVWVAHHDGGKPKPWREVKPPVPYIVEGGIEKKGVVRPGVGYRLTPVTLSELFQDFNTLQARGLRGDSITIEDQTGLPQPPAYDEGVHGTYKKFWSDVIEPTFLVASDSPYFAGKESPAMAKAWYRSELGITFTEETRPVTIHVIQRKGK